MKNIYIIIYTLLTALFGFSPFEAGAQLNVTLSLSKVIDTLSFDASDALMQRLRFENELLQFENYKKGFLPAVSLSMSPVSFNRSIVKLPPCPFQ